MKITLPAGNQITILKGTTEDLTVTAAPSGIPDGTMATFKVISTGKDHVTLSRNGAQPFHLQAGDDLVVVYHPAKILNA